MRSNLEVSKIANAKYVHTYIIVGLRKHGRDQQHFPQFVIEEGGKETRML